MILDELKIPNLSYEILEGDNRIGGRVYTHYFTDKETAIKNHDYYDVGNSLTLSELFIFLTFYLGWRYAFSGHSYHEKVKLCL